MLKRIRLHPAPLISESSHQPQMPCDQLKTFPAKYRLIGRAVPQTIKKTHMFSVFLAHGKAAATISGAAITTIRRITEPDKIINVDNAAINMQIAAAIMPAIRPGM